MNRVIKFRVWNGVIKRYECYAPLVTLVHSKKRIVELAQNDSITLEQFTGLLDKNGVEIYENGVEIYENDEIKSKYYNGIVKFIDTLKYDYLGWYILEQDEYGDSPQLFDKNNAKDFEIIGNIHTKEALNEKDN
jgi:uncharacterized phage protein (TIGR01671 family)